VKVQIIHLDPQDDRVSISDRLGWVQAPRILLVWPGHGRLLTSRLDLVLLQRRARKVGAHLGLVVDDPEVRDLAHSLDIPVFDSPEDLPEEGWRRKPRGERLSRSSERSRASIRETPRVAPKPVTGRRRQAARIARYVLFALAVSAVLATVASVFPSAVVVLSPVTETQHVELTLILDPEVGSPSASGRIPAIPVSLRVQGETRLATTGSVPVADEVAAGSVQFTNLTEDSLTIPVGAGLRTSDGDPVRYLTTEEATLPAGPGSTATARVQAAAPGSGGNSQPGAVTTVEGPLGLQVTVVNLEAISGGTDEPRASVSLADRSTALRQLTAQLLDEAEGQIGASLEPGTALAPSSLRVVREFARTFDHEAGEASDSLGLSLDVEIAGYAYREADSEEAARLAMDRPGRNVDEVPGSFVLLGLGEPTTDARGTTSFQARAQRLTAPGLNEDELRLLVRGRSPREAAALLEERLNLASPPEFRLHPRWFPRLPWLTIRLSIRWDWEVQ
jgi:hypothetical protein